MNKHLAPGAKHFAQTESPSEKYFSGNGIIRKIQTESLAGPCTGPWGAVTRNLAQMVFLVSWECEEGLSGCPRPAEVLMQTKKHSVGQAKGKKNVWCVQLLVMCSALSRGCLEPKQWPCGSCRPSSVRGAQAAKGAGGAGGGQCRGPLRHEPLVTG